MDRGRIQSHVRTEGDYKMLVSSILSDGRVRAFSSSHFGQQHTPSTLASRMSASGSPAPNSKSSPKPAAAEKKAPAKKSPTVASHPPYQEMVAVSPFVAPSLLLHVPDLVLLHIYYAHPSPSPPPTHPNSLV